MPPAFQSGLSRCLVLTSALVFPLAVFPFPPWITDILGMPEAGASGVSRSMVIEPIPTWCAAWGGGSVSACPQIYAKSAIAPSPTGFWHPYRNYFLKKCIKGGLHLRNRHDIPWDSKWFPGDAARSAPSAQQGPAAHHPHIAPPGGQRTSQKAQVVSAEDRQTQTLHPRFNPAHEGATGWQSVHH
jgi:hypothetical protein